MGLSCNSRPKPKHGHDFALLECFRPGELETALKILGTIPPPYDHHPWYSDVIDPILSKQIRCPPDADDIVRVKLSGRAGLPSYSTLYTTLASGVPMVVSGIKPGGHNLSPEFFVKSYGKEIVTVINTVTHATRTIELATFMEKFGVFDVDVEPEKLKVS